MTIRQSSTVLLATDQNTSVLQCLSTASVQSIAYTPFGYAVEEEYRMTSGFSGEARETQTQTYLLGHGYRTYDPRLQRFHAPDELSPFAEGDMNSYAYCSGDPLNYVDPTGHFLASRIAKRTIGTTSRIARGAGDIASPLHGVTKASDLVQSRATSITKAIGNTAAPTKSSFLGSRVGGAQKTVKWAKSVPSVSSPSPTNRAAITPTATTASPAKAKTKPRAEFYMGKDGNIYLKQPKPSTSPTRAWSISKQKNSIVATQATDLRASSSTQATNRVTRFQWEMD